MHVTVYDVKEGEKWVWQEQLRFLRQAENPSRLSRR